ncbi:MAG: VWA domain-containing protein [Planctomycetes bacterium]|nr:VWA domain-containing protein [Planctomycetota bacterium]
MEALASFRHPWVLLALVIPAAACLWAWQGRARALALPFDHVHGARDSRLRFLLRAAECLPALVLAGALFVLAGPQSWAEPRSKRALTNIQFCVDVSGSMMAPFGQGDRYDAAMRSINSFVDRRDGDAFGLTFFGNNVLHWVPLTNDISAFRCAPPFMHPRNLPSWFGGTEIGKALRACRKVLAERPDGDRMIVLVSDGFSSDLSGGADEEIAREMRAEGISVYTVHIAEGAIPEEVVRIATLTGGEAFKPEDEGGLDSIFARIDAMARAKLEKSQAEASDDYVPWCLAGLGALLALVLASFGLRYTPW